MLTSIVAGLLLAAGAWFTSHTWFVVVGVAIAWAILVAATITQLRRRVLVLRAPMSSQAAQARIASAHKEIWSFQISGSEFTAHSVEAYEQWLRADPERRLNIAFANPSNTGLLHSIVKLSGIGKMSSDADALEHLRQIIVTSLRKYTDLSIRLDGQVDVRVYDCSPPFSIHAVDPTSDSRQRSIFVELHLPELPSRERPCFLMRWNHSSFALYTRQSDAWFREATAAPSATDEPTARR